LILHDIYIKLTLLKASSWSYFKIVF